MIADPGRTPMNLHRARRAASLCALGILLGSASASAAPPLGTTVETPGMKGKVTINERGGAKIHTYAFSPTNVTTHIIETADGLVVIDAQMTIPDTREAIAYTRSLGKPIRRLIISHGHPDHWLGLGEWSDVPAASIADVKDFVNGEKGTAIYRGFKEGIPPYRALGPQLSDKRGTISETLPARERIIGLDFEFERVLDGEADVQLVTRLPQLQTLIVQDLVYNNMHHFIGQNRLATEALPTFDGWINTMRKIKGDNPNTALLLVGHGAPTGPAAIDETIAYLGKAKEMFQKAKDREELKRLMEAAFPGLDGIRYIDIASNYMYRKP
jgi:glyoxylase-like metal-dependent hydrolase (beta-lactamase superfamily II)